MNQTGRISQTTRATAKKNERRVLLQQTMANEATPGWAQQLLTEVAELKKSFEQRLDAIDSSVKDIKKETRAIGNRVMNAEKRIGDLEDANMSAAQTLTSLSQQVKMLQTKCTNMEAQSKRNNLVLIGLDEGLEKDDPDKMLQDILKYVLDLTDTDPVPEVERHHRSLRPRPAPSDPPRPYLVRMLRWADRQRILQAAVTKKQLAWRGKPFRIFQDLPVEIKRKRAEYDGIKKKLRGSGIRYGVIYPSRFIVTINGEKHIYNNEAEASLELKRKLPNIFD